MLARLRVARAVALQWLPLSGVVASDASSARRATTKTPPKPQKDFLDQYMNVDMDVRQRFVEVQRKYQKFFDAQADIEIPLDGNEAKIKKYHDQLAKLRKKFEIPDKVEVMRMLMKEKIRMSRGSVRKWVQDMESVFGEALHESMTRMVADVEKEIGTALLFPTKETPKPKGWSLFQKKHEALLKECGLKKPMTKEEILWENTKYELDKIVEHAQETMDEAAEKLGITTTVDARTLKTTISRDLN